MYPYDNQNQLYQQLLQPLKPKREVVRVNGKPGVDAYQLGPNESDLLLDNTAPLVWLVQTDGAGYKSSIPYDIKPHEEKPAEDRYKVLEDRITKLEEAINGKSNTTNVSKRKSESAD